MMGCSPLTPGVEKYVGDDWRCSVERFNRQVERSRELESLLHVEKISVWYDGAEDYVKTRFKLGNDTFVIQVYKVFAVYKNGRCNFMQTMHFNSWQRLLNFFLEGKHIKWETMPE